MTLCLVLRHVVPKLHLSAVRPAAVRLPSGSTEPPCVEDHNYGSPPGPLGAREETCPAVESYIPAFGSPKTKTALPSGKLSWKFPPAATATYSSPSSSNTDGAALAPEPQLNFHRTAPVLASYALNQPFPSPVNTSPPAVAVAPPIMGCSVFTDHAIFPVLRSIALTLPYSPE